MNIKLIVTDLDNTLLRRDKTISDYTRNVFARCRERGVRVAFATGRSRSKVLEFVGDMATDALMLNNGAYIVADGRLLAKHTLSSEAQSGLLRDLAKCSTVSEIHYLDGETNNATPTVALCMLNVICRDHAIPFDVIRKYSDVTAITYENKSGAFVLPVGVSKRNAIVTLSEHWGILPYEVVVFGDDYNDIDMLSLPGVVSVAVANAIPEVKAVASHVCGDCDEDGVAKWLEENAL